MSKIRLTDEERERKRKERNRKVLESYKRSSNGVKGSAEKWKQAAEMLLRHAKDTDINIALKELKIQSLPSSLKELARVWKKRIIETHPDKGGDVKEASAVNNAYALLKTFFDEPIIETTPTAVKPATAPINGLIEPSRCTASLPDDLVCQAVHA